MIKKVVLYILVITLSLLMMFATGYYLSTRDIEVAREGEEEPKTVITDVVPDLYDGAEISINREEFMRGRFDQVVENRLYLEFTAHGNPTRIREILLERGTTFDCVSRYRAAPDGTQIDRLNIFIDTSRLETSPDKLPSPQGKSVEWFITNVERGEAIDIYFAIKEDRTRFTYTVRFTRETCPI